ncbi:hypothetical protein HELRODRAFT_175804 [Helobdella robusta]|uniref:Uncharacterized protein n=1 Tax=Helobdella robusta TaxID=6412 RepID=T1F9P0_HELRO|nr:hypothetical protein HELRODRAFT_175804 [Helobdella robusta]ESO00387.1 hypothetical protein HELRODRAFT_175804 [Helobdella robusta]
MWTSRTQAYLGSPCQNSPKCVHCKQKHETFPKDCAKFLLKKSIIKKKIECNIPYNQAKAQISQNQNLYTLKLWKKQFKIIMIMKFFPLSISQIKMLMAFKFFSGTIKG